MKVSLLHTNSFAMFAGNSPIYNLLPDVLSCLSRNETLSKTQFRSIMRYLLSFISKDKQSESLVDKLSNRFQATDGSYFTLS